MNGSTERFIGRIGRGTVLFAAIAAFLTIGVSPAFPGKTNVVCGQVIVKNIHVGNDLLNCPNDGLVVGADKIKIDLGGHVIDGDGINTATDDGIDNTGGFDGVKITHGTIQQFSQGVSTAGATGGKIEHLHVLQTFRGIEVDAASDNNKIDHNSVTGNFDGIHLVGSDGNKIDHNDVFANTASAIVLITGSDNNRVEHNRAHDNPSWGITSDFTTGNVYAHNKVFNNGIAGIEPFHSPNTKVDHNDLTGNSIGIELFDTDNSFLTDNHIKKSTHDGIHLFSGSTGNQLVRNHTNENGNDGIEVNDTGNTLKKNHADKNVVLGIFAVPGNVDGGGNKARHNGNPAQCVGVTCK
jgi:parallel beta-helix repeat protein